MLAYPNQTSLETFKNHQVFSLTYHQISGNERVNLLAFIPGAGLRRRAYGHPRERGCHRRP